MSFCTPIRRRFLGVLFCARMSEMASGLGRKWSSPVALLGLAELRANL
jgi:hypothetical protein